MFLRKLYSEPLGLFAPILFKNGVNFIFGKKEVSSNNTNKPLNGIGKSTITDLIDFCLLADFNNKNERLYREKKRIEPYKIVLEFEVNGIEYIIKRNITDNKEVELGTKNNLEKLDINKDAKPKLFKLIFNNPEYQGKLDEKWYRTLMPFFLKIHKKGKGEYTDPIKYFAENKTLTELNQYHFFFLGIDNTLVCQNFELQKSVKDRDTAINQVKKLIEQNYSLNIKSVNAKISMLKNEVKKIEIAINSFKLAEQHKDVEKRLNELTTNIKLLASQIFWVERQIKIYEDSFGLKDSLSERNITNIEKLYHELNIVVATAVRKSLEEAVEFRKNLAKSREDFLKDEIITLKRQVRKDEKEKNELEEQRIKLFTLLQSKEAFTDLTQAFYYLGERKKELSDLEAKIKTYQDLEIEKQNWKSKDAQISIDIFNWFESIETQISAFEEIFSYVYGKIYPKSASSGFAVTPNYETNSKISIDISFDDDNSKGWNKGRTLIYDIAVIIHAIKKQINMSRFLIHDGIFDGMDKSLFVELYHFVQNLQKEGTIFQYIVTINEEGTLGQNFGNTDDLTTEKIAEEAIVVLTPNKKFWLG